MTQSKYGRLDLRARAPDVLEMVRDGDEEKEAFKYSKERGYVETKTHPTVAGANNRTAWTSGVPEKAGEEVCSNIKELRYFRE